MALTIDGTNGIETNTDTGKIKVGAGDDLSIYHNGSHGYLQNDTGTLRLESPEVGILSSDGSETMAQFVQNGAVSLRYDNSTKFETNATGITVNGTIVPNADNTRDLGSASLQWKDVHIGNDLYMADNAEARFGENEDFKIWHNGTDSYIQNYTGNLFIRGDGDDIFLKAVDTEDSLICRPNAGVEIFYDNSKKFETGSNGTITWGTAYHEAGGIMATYAHTGTGESVRFRANTGTVVGSISVSGSATAFNQSSDYRLKENEVAISDGIARLKTLKPYRFNFKTEPSKTVDGFFAHEVTPAVPEAITGEKDGTEMQGIDQSKLVPLLTAALQEAITKIETLETKVAALEAA